VYQFVFPFSLFLSASLLFLIQPMVAKVLLPIYGGTPAVWTVCMLFFQLLLLISYAYVWGLSKLKGRYTWRVIHLCVCLLSLSVLPLAFLPSVGTAAPELSILTNLLIQLGLPLLVVGASAPLLQYAFSQTTGKRAADPYFLYVASNIGSLLALISYPLLVERYRGIQQQFYDWNVIYLVYVLFLVCLLFMVRYQSGAQLTDNKEKIVLTRRVLWVFLSFVPCSLMLGVTFYISTDVAATPLFWVLPLALYLLSFVITFASKPIISHAWVVRNTLFVLLFPILGFIVGAHSMSMVQLIIANVLGFFMLALLCHGQLIQTRPDAHQLTTFYFCLALGGVLAGIFNGLVAPRLFSHAYEYPLVLLLGLLCIPIQNSHKQREWLMPSLVLGILVLSYVLPWQWLKEHHVAEILALTLILVFSSSRYSLFLGMTILFVFIFMPWFKPTQILSQQRNFYGIKQVFSKDGAHVLMSQSTLHGFQVQLDKKPTDGARGYYGAIFPVIQQLEALHEPLHTMILGLGTGIMACQFRQQDKLAIVEIDDQVIDIATNPTLFTYLRDCPPHTQLIKDDGRLAVAKEQDTSYELFVMDAFNSDAIPIHLLTLEAFALYKQKLTPDGVILVNISNRHLGVLPVLTAAGRELDMIVLHKLQAGNNSLGQFPSEWALLTTNERLAGSLLSKEGWRFVADAKTQLWTNDYSNLLPLLKW
jgi:hypothetical protein